MFSMAETVKKSRIVSEPEDNLEESLLEEFNLRLKKCMSGDDLKNGTENGEKEAGPKTNGHHEEPVPVPKPNLTLPTTCLIASESVDVEHSTSVKDRMFLSTDDASCLLFTQTVTSPMLTPSEENIDFLKGFRRESTVSDTTSSSPKELETQKPELSENKVTTTIIQNVSVNGCEVIQPPSDENSELEEVLNLTEENSEVVEAPCLPEENCEVGEVPCLENNEVGEVPNLESEEAANFEEVREVLHLTQEITSPNLKEESSKFIKSEREMMEFDLIMDVSGRLEEKPSSECCEIEGDEATFETDARLTEEVQLGSNNVANETECDLEDAELSDCAKELSECATSSLLEDEVNECSNEQNEELNGTPLIDQELDELKSLNVMKQISKFECATNLEVTNDSSNLDVSTVVQSHFVETTTEMHASGEVSLKKKKSKKSKNQHEKENISVSDTNINEEESLYKVNVKSLCRSFGDLTKLEAEQYHNLKNSERGRTRSMSDVRAVGLKNIENVFGGVSVKALRERFCVVNVHTNSGMLTIKRPRSSVLFSSMKSSFSKFDALQKKNVLNNSKSADSENINGLQEGTNCKKCGRAVFHMEKIIAERCVYHRNCFRCTECSKQLLVDNFETHEGTLYCKPHFKALFAPKAVEDDVPASDKPDLGLEELHSLNVKERFQVFENAQHSSETQVEKGTIKMERSPSILSKLARFQAKGMDIGVSDDALNGVPVEASSSDEEQDGEELDGEDADLVRAKRVQKEKPFHFSQMSDVKNKWEKGNQQQNRDERREERKQEIQNIRSRLFMGKQGKMKEAYQQAISESQSMANIKKEVPLEAIDARSIKDKFEKGELTNNEVRHKETEDMSVFESGIGKKSRTIFQELDSTGGKPPMMRSASPPKISASVRNARESPTPEREMYVDPNIVRSDDYIEDSIVAKTTHTATKMLSKFRQMEENLQKGQEPQGPKPLKRFTPPREPIRRETSSEEEESGSEEEEEVDSRLPERDLIEAQKAARAKQLKAKFEHWEESEEKEVRRDSVNITEEYGDDQSQIETAKSLRAKFESLKEHNISPRQPARVKVNRFVFQDVTANLSQCTSCHKRVYPLEQITVHGHVFHRNCFRCKECSAVLRMDSYTYNQGLLYCTTHFKRLFISKGNYDTAFGLEQHKEKWNVTTVA